MYLRAFYYCASVIQSQNSLALHFRCKCTLYCIMERFAEALMSLLSIVVSRSRKRFFPATKKFLCISDSFYIDVYRKFDVSLSSNLKPLTLRSRSELYKLMFIQSFSSVSCRSKRAKVTDEMTWTWLHSLWLSFLTTRPLGRVWSFGWC